MPRTKSIPATYDSPYFKDVTPLWVAPFGSVIDPKYHPAIQSLAEWAGPNWPHNELTNFFPLRQILLAECESWRAYDWSAARLRAKDRMLENRRRRQVGAAADKFLTELQSAPFTAEKVNLIRSILWSLGAETNGKVTNRRVVDVLEQSIESFVRQVDARSSAGFEFGPIVYGRVPKLLPRPEVAVALALADRVSTWRRDCCNSGGIHYPRRPIITKNLPWKAIALFAAPPFADPDDFLNSENVQMLVTSLSRNVVAVTTPPRNPK